LIGCEFDTRRLVRMSLQRVGDHYQGAVYPFSISQANQGADFIGPLAAAVSPRGELYIGCLRDSGWGGANNIGAIVRFTPDLEQLPTGIAEVQALSNGFRLIFTHPVDLERARSIDSYAISSYRRIPTPDYGGPDVDRRVERPIAAKVSEDRRQVELQFSEMRPGFVYEFHLRNLCAGASAGSATPMFFPAEAYYTLNNVPR
jgi:hypothetical protein